MTTEKGKAWKKRVSNPKYLEGWDRVFGKKDEDETEEEEETECDI